MPVGSLQMNWSHSAYTSKSVIRLHRRTELNEFLLSQKCNPTGALGKIRMKRLAPTSVPRRQVFWNACFGFVTGLIFRPNGFGLSIV